jgi:hypothetical protein
MAKLRPGIEFPIIPEDLIFSEPESLQLNQGQEYPNITHCCSAGILPDDWITIERIIRQCPEG